MTYNSLESSQSSELSFNSGFLAKLFSKSTSCVIVAGIFIKPYETQNPCINLLLHNFFTFGPTFFIADTQTIVNRNRTTYARRLQIQRFLIFFFFFFNLTHLVGILFWGQFQGNFLDNLILTFLELFRVLN